MNFKVIILDFDGVVLESIEVKNKAFLRVYEDYPEYAKEITQYHLQNGGISRYKKFEHINKNILDIPINDSIMKELSLKFSETVINEMLKCSFVDGALEFLVKYSGITRIYVASGTPQDELRLIVKYRKLQPYFKGVYGTPSSKVEILKNILGEEKITDKDAIYVGDALTDYESAKETKIPFIARINKQIPDNPLLKMNNLISVNDLRELDRMLKG